MATNEPSLSRRIVRMIAAIAVAVLVAAGCLGNAWAQGPPAKGTAGIDLTGYWVSLIVDDLRFHITPQKGDLEYLPLNNEGKRVAMMWDPDRDMAQGNACKAYGAVGLMQQPGRLHITWADENTLRIDADAGGQTRLLHFGAPQAAGASPSLQGYSEARWEGGRMTGRGGGMQTSPDSLTVVTRNMITGYLRKNGAPYSGKAVLTEYFNIVAGPNGQTYLSVTASVDDPTYLTAPYFDTHIFKKLPDGSGWDPTPCWPK